MVHTLVLQSLNRRPRQHNTARNDRGRAIHRSRCPDSRSQPGRHAVWLLARARHIAEKAADHAV